MTQILQKRCIVEIRNENIKSSQFRIIQKLFRLGGLQDLESHMTTTPSCIIVQEHFQKTPTITNQ